MLVRRKVAKLLADYYAQPANQVVGSARHGTIHFSRLWGEWHYRRLVARLYKQQEGRWLTPVELMGPFYSQTLGNFVAAAQATNRKSNSDNNTGAKFDVVEIGGGRATNASVLLTHLQHSHPDVYQQLNSYTLIDASPTLLQLQEDTMKYTDHYPKMIFQLKNMIDVAEQKVPFLTPSKIPTVVLGCELLDNLPHDKVRIKSGKKLVIEQAEVVCSKQTQSSSSSNNSSSNSSSNAQQEQQVGWREMFVPLKDPLLSKVLQIAPKTYTGTSATMSWIPSVACGLLQRIHRQRPNTTLLLADFDCLPPPDVVESTKEDAEASNARRTSHWAAGEPIVTDMQGIDHVCYLQAPPNCDILFPTDFSKLASFVSKSWGISPPTNTTSATADRRQQLQVNVLKQSDFLQLYGPEQVNATKSWLTGFSPMLHDFANCSVLTVTRRGSL